MTEAAIIDAVQRESALDISRSFCVQAPAGSGKTELLTQRLLKLLLVSDRPEDILAFTFTRKAAFEMRQRLLFSLRQENPDKLTELTNKLARQVLERDTAMQWHLLENPQRLQISTIDSFNVAICAQLPVVSGLGSRVEIVEDARLLYQDAIASLFKRLEGEDDSVTQALAVLLQHLDNNLGRAQELLSHLLQKRDQWLLHILRMQHRGNMQQELGKNLQLTVSEALQDAAEQLEPYTSELMALLQFAAENLQRDGNDSLSRFSFSADLPASSPEHCLAWQAIASFLLTNEGSLRKAKGITVKNGFPAKGSGKTSTEKQLFEERKSQFASLLDKLAEYPEIVAALQAILIMPALDYQQDEWQILESLSTVLLELVKELNISLQQQSQADYIHLSASALDALGHEESISDLALRMDYRIKHILVDEFQDTSQQQIELLKRLTRGWEKDDGRTLFIVGDGMQSCYGFRNADVGLFLRARDKGIGPVSLEKLQLQMNFRSHSGLVQEINHIFSASFPARDNISRGAVSYSASQAVRQADTAGLQLTYFIQSAEDKVTREQCAATEAETILQHIKQLPADSDCSVAILVRSRNYLQAIIPALRAAGVAWNAAGIDSLGSFAVIKDLLSLLQSLLNLADITALFALLRSPFVGLQLQDIHCLKMHADARELSLWEILQSYEETPGLSSDAQQRLQRCIPVLTEARQQRGWGPLRDWLENTWRLLGGPACLGRDYELLYVERFLALLEKEADGHEITDIHHLKKLCQETYLGSSHDKNTPLQIMTIHNAKGLEFDYVFIPGLDRTPPPDKKNLFLWQELASESSESRLILAPLNARGEEDNATYQYLANEASQRRELESTRLLYIAVTRAREKAFLYARLTRDEKNLFRAPPRSSLLGRIWPAISNNIQEEDCIVLSMGGNSQTPTDQSQGNFIQRLSNTWQMPEPETPAQAEIVEYSDHESYQHILDRKIGEIIHHCLLLKVEKNTDVLQSDLLPKYKRLWTRVLGPCCSDQNTLDKALARVIDNLQACMTHEKAAWLFDPSHTQSACELSLSDYRQGWRKEHVIDRTFVADDIRWIIDYKSSAPAAGQSLEQFVSQQAQRYSPQLKRYAGLFRDLENSEIKTALFFTSLPYWHEIEL